MTNKEKTLLRQLVKEGIKKGESEAKIISVCKLYGYSTSTIIKYTIAFNDKKLLSKCEHSILNDGQCVRCKKQILLSNNGL